MKPRRKHLRQSQVYAMCQERCRWISLNSKLYKKKDGGSKMPGARAVSEDTDNKANESMKLANNRGVRDDAPAVTGGDRPR